MAWERINPRRGAHLGDGTVSVALAAAKSAKSAPTLNFNFSAAVAASLGWKHTDRLVIDLDRNAGALRFTPASAKDRNTFGIHNRNRTLCCRMSWDIASTKKAKAEIVEHAIQPGGVLEICLPQWALPPRAVVAVPAPRTSIMARVPDPAAAVRANGGRPVQ